MSIYCWELRKGKDNNKASHNVHVDMEDGSEVEWHESYLGSCCQHCYNGVDIQVNFYGTFLFHVCYFLLFLGMLLSLHHHLVIGAVINSQ